LERPSVPIAVRPEARIGFRLYLPNAGRGSSMGKKKSHAPSRTAPNGATPATKKPVHSLLDLYRKQTGRKLTAIEIEDPYAAPQHDAATLVSRAGHTAQHNPDGPKEWLAPRRGRIQVLVSTVDVIAGMYARHQIDEAMFSAARHYQHLTLRAGRVGNIQSVDLTAPVVSGGLRNQYAAMDDALRASRELTEIEAKVAIEHGEEGVSLLRDVVGREIRIADAARERGQGHMTTWWGGYFRRSLRCLAEVTGFAVRNAYAHREYRDEVLERQEENRRRREEREERRMRDRKRGRKKEAGDVEGSEAESPDGTQGGMQGG
jgi:hypothetical protein